MKVSTVLLWLALLVAPVVGQAQVTASLVAADTSAQPGHPLTVAVVLVHEPTWHTYWSNAGTGYATRIEWDLPRGWSAGGIQWPTPRTLTAADGSVTGNGYTGSLYLPVALLVPSDASLGGATLKAHVSWLMCADQCIPGDADLTAKIDVASQAPVPDAEVHAALSRQSRPRPVSAQTVTAARTGNEVTLRVRSAEAMEQPHFFSEDGLIAYDEPQKLLTGEGTLALSLSVAEDAAPNSSTLRGVLAYTTPDGLYKGVEVDAPLSGAAVRASEAAGRIGKETSSAWGTLLLALAGGVILNLMPCVFPVLGIKVMAVVSQAGAEPRKMILHGLAYSAGVLLSFWVLAGMLAALRAGGNHLGWGFQLQSAPFVFGMAGVMLIFALGLSGVFEFGTRVMGLASQAPGSAGVAGSFWTGALATLVATPCSAPLLAPALGTALAVPVAQSFLIFTFVALGLSLPYYLLLCLAPRALAFLPKPGRWMQTFKQLMAFPLYGTVAYLVWVLAGQTSENALLMALLGLTVIALSVWLHGRSRLAPSNARRARLLSGLATLLLGGGVYMGWPTQGSAATDVTWEPWSAKRVAELRAAGRPLYIDFTARWCATWCWRLSRRDGAREELTRQQPAG